jgi:hypothetical protein
LHTKCLQFVRRQRGVFIRKKANNASTIFKHKDSKERIYLHLLGQIRAKKYPHAATATLHEMDEE